MVQIRTTRFHALDTSLLQNAQLEGVVRPGVYKGYKIRPNAAESNKLDITHGNDGTSILVTTEGVKVEENTELFGAVAVQNADPNLTRIDLVVAEYQFSTDNDVDQAYKVIRGRYPSGPTVAATAPAVQNEFQVPLALVTVRPQLASGGTPQARVELTDVVHVREGIDARAPEDISSLMPVVAPSDARRIFVHEGILPSFDGTSTITFPGAHSELIDPTTLADGESRFYLFGLDDDSDVVLIGDADTVEGLPAFNRDVFPVCHVKGTKVPSTNAITFTELVDLRFPFARQLDPTDEEEPYKSTLADSVFDHLRTDLFRSLDGIELTSLGDPDPDNVEVELDRGTTSMNLKATATPTAEVTIVTKDMLRGTSISNVEHFMMVVDTNFDGLEVRFSTTSAFSGFVSARSRPNSIVRIPVGGGSQLYIQFIVPVSAFEAGTPKIFSYGCFMVLNENVVNANTVSDVGIDSLKNAVPNLIANGNFRHWSRDDVNGNPTDPDSQVEIAYPLDEDNPFAADGWQFTKLEAGFGSESGQIKRVGLSKDVLQAGLDNANDTALRWEGTGGAAGTLKTNTLEYRTKVAPGTQGRRVTFAMRYRVNSIAVISIGVALYERTPQGTLRLQGNVTQAGASVVQGDLSVISELAINERTFAIGFLVFFNQGTGTTTADIWNARAAIGEFRSLPYNEPVDATDILRKYYERGKAFISNNVVEGQQIGTGVQFGSRKVTGIGELEAQTVDQSDSNRSLNVNTPVYDVTADGIVVTAEAVSNGTAKIDVDFEAFLRYAEVL